MSATIATVTLDAESELAIVLANPEIDLVYVVQGDRRYVIVPEEAADRTEGHDPADFRSGGPDDQPMHSLPVNPRTPRLELADPKDTWQNYDPERAIAAMRAIQGVLSPDAADEWIREIYAAREAGSRPTHRP